MTIVLIVLALLMLSLLLAFLRSNAALWSALSIVLAAAVGYAAGSAREALIAAIVLALLTLPFAIVPLRRALFGRSLLKAFAHALPRLSDTERTALDAGTVGFEAELFSGKPDWHKLLAEPKPALSAEEQAFMDGPVERLCAMLDDWRITHELADLPPEVWAFLKREKFFGMIIPKRYGGLEFSALAHSAVLQKVSSICPTASSTIAVPNSLGPAELLLHYGSEQQKDYYLPRLADGREVPCFALTGPYAGSDATSIPDYGIVCRGQWKGEEVLGVRLTFDKRYITLAPIATLIGLAFRLYDPEHLIGSVEDRGITLALIPRETSGLDIGRRHMPLNIPFQNGPVRGKDVFVPLAQLIGGPGMAGHGWRMLVENLSVGRAISLPSNAAGFARMAIASTGAYARLRKQFGLAIARFEGVEEALARIGGMSYLVTALSRSTAAAVDRGEKPAVTSAIAKYHATEIGREVARDAMDVHGGKGIILGPGNYLGRNWQGAPISITVEGANIMTRSLMIFGQGAIRCHPWVLKEMAAVAEPDRRKALRDFDAAMFGHVGFGLSNAVRSFVLALSLGRLSNAPGDAHIQRYYRKLNRYSAALALCADVAMGTLGGRLKFKEKLSARLGDILSYLYIGSALLKRYEDNGRPEAERPLLAFAFHESIWRLQNALDGVIRNFPIRPVAWLLRALVFPLGRREVPPSDRLGRRVAAAITAPGPARAAVLEWCYLTPTPNHPVGRLHALLPDVVAAEPIERKLQKALKTGAIKAHDYLAQVDEAARQGVLSAAEAALLRHVREAGAEFITVDDFDPADLRAGAAARADVAAVAGGVTRVA
ncbi:acyl-CoA dehydrogenase [Metallibacterium sp.]|uniref:acyl-CoA dehydrogenase n=1 Tax=Metallibacterium sp. TaxID=2940281 RepID=UPI0026117E4F|nr:acyl-CoA dehydrogenase [Metallibacterium sp.]